MQNPPIARRVGIVDYDGVMRSAALGLADLLEVASGLAALEGGSARIEPVRVSPEDLPETAFAAIVFPPSLTGARGAEARRLHRWARDRHGEGALACSVCAGAFFLGHAGLLDGRPATTHWALEAEFCAAFPKADLQPDQILVDDHDLVTAGGVMAWADLGLHLARRWLGAEVVSRTARHMLVEPGAREQGAWRTFRPRLDHGDAGVRGLQRWMEGAPEADLSVEALAARAALSPRTLQRRFQRATGLTPGAYARALRVEKAKGMLERTARPVAEIGHAVGYEDIPAFIRLFKGASGMTPGEYRKRFSPG